MDPVQVRVALPAADPPDNLNNHHEKPECCRSVYSGQEPNT